MEQGRIVAHKDTEEGGHQSRRLRLEIFELIAAITEDRRSAQILIVDVLGPMDHAHEFAQHQRQHAGIDVASDGQGLFLPGFQQQGQPAQHRRDLHLISPPTVEIEKDRHLRGGHQRENLGDILRAEFLHQQIELLRRQRLDQGLEIDGLDEESIFPPGRGLPHHVESFGKGEGVELAGGEHARLTQNREMANLSGRGEIDRGHGQ